ncbi:MAG: dihydrofolate reductase [Planctomycetota bacterium]
MTPRVSKLSAAALWILILTFVGGCQPVEEREGATDLQSEAADGFQYEAERFADLRVLRFQVPGFDQLDLQKKKLVYYLYEAALAGREIIYDQKHHMNLAIKRTLEEIYRHYPGDRETPAFQAYVTYLKRIWFANGIHHHYSSDKFAPGFSFDDLNGWVQATIQSEESSAAAFPTREGQTVDQLLAELRPVMFDASVDAKLVNKEKGSDLVAGSAVNFYTGVTQKEVEAFYKERMDSKDPRPISWGLNSTLVKKDDGSLAEVVWKVGGKYTGALKPVADWIEKAAGVAENAKQKKALEKLAVYFRSGSLKDWDDYNIAWVQDVDSDVDVINGFIEVYNDSMGYRGSFESVVSVRDPIATKRIEAIAKKAQWFEDNSPLIESHKKKEVTGITARVINVVVESGDCSPTSPIGINLPNANWIRKEHGSKSVNLANIVNSYNQVAGASLDEFCWDAAEANRAREHGELADMLHTDMHEVIGHASGQINEGVGTPKQTLKNYSSTLEEARADLVALY